MNKTRVRFHPFMVRDSSIGALPYINLQDAVSKAAKVALETLNDVTVTVDADTMEGDRGDKVKSSTRMEVAIVRGSMFVVGYVE